MVFSNKFFYLVLLFTIFSLIYLLSPILTPFLIGALIAYLADPLVNRLVARKIPRILAVVIVFFSLFSILTLMVILLIPIVQKQINNLVALIPASINYVQTNILPWLQSHLGFDLETINVDNFSGLLLDNLKKAGGLVNWLFQMTLHSGMRLIEWLINLILIPVVTFYLLCDWQVIIQGIRQLLPRRIEPTVVKLVKECDSVLSAFFRGQLMVMVAMGGIYSIGLSIVGLKVGVLVGIICGALSIVPYLGTIVGVIIGTVAALIQSGTLYAALMVNLIFLVGHLIDNLYVTPRLVGNRIGIHPVAVIFAILAGGHLFGFFGILIALPLVAVLMVWIRYFLHRYRSSDLYQV